MDDDGIRAVIRRIIGTVDSILDVGCGDCSLVRWLARNITREAVGVDVSWRDLPARIWFEADDGGSTAKCLRCDARSMSIFPDGRFDAAVTVRALHELAHPDAALSEIGRVLRNGGTLLVADFSEGELDADESYYSPEAVASLLRNSGFSDVSAWKVLHDTFLFAVGESWGVPVQ